MIVKAEKRGEWVFNVKKWFDEKKEDKKLQREIAAAGDGKDEEDYLGIQNFAETLPDKKLESAYTIEVKTADLRGAGSQASVFINLFGTEAESGVQSLESSPDSFSRGKTDVFSIKTKEIGDLTKIQIGHDNTGNNHKGRSSECDIYQALARIGF